MFAGIVAEVGEVVKTDRTGGDLRVWIRAGLLSGCELGASVAVDGVCLTVVDAQGEVCGFDVSAETVVRSTLGAREPGQAVNLERPLRAGEEIGGHIVQGHVDGLGTVTAVESSGESRRVWVTLPDGLDRYIVEKGSVAVDGVSLTVSALRPGAFEVAVVPHTLGATTLGEAGPGRKVNIEVDVLAKYVERYCQKIGRSSEGPSEAS